MKKLFVLAAVSATGLAGLHAQSTPIQLSLTPDIALHSRDTMVQGFSLGIWSENPQQSFTLGIVNGSTGNSGGFSWGIVNYSENYTGVQWGCVNVSKGDFIGWQRAYVNVSLGTFEGFQLGAVNVSMQTTGFQLGAFNYAQSLRGLQIGFVNIAANNPWFTEFPDKLATGFPIVNWSF